MSLNDLIGFLVSFGVFIFLMVRNVMRKGKQESDFDEEEEEEEEVIFAPPRPKVPFVKKKAFSQGVMKKTSPVSDYAKQGKAIEDRYSGSSMLSAHYEDLASSTPYEVENKARPSRAAQLMRHLKSKKDMVVLKEILDRPKSFRP